MKQKSQSLRAIITPFVEKQHWALNASLVSTAVMSMLLSMPQIARAQCVESGSTVTCSNALNTSTIINVPSTVDTLVLDSSFEGTFVDTVGFRFISTTDPASGEIKVDVQEGATVSRTGNAIDIFFVRASGDDDSHISIAGELKSGDGTSASRVLRHQVNNSLPGTSHDVIVAESGLIDSTQTALWTRTAGSSTGGEINYDIAGTVKAETVRGIHISQNVDAPIPVNVVIRESGLIDVGQQGIYVGNNGSELTTVNVDGTVIGGWNTSSLGGFGPTAAIIIQAESGGSLIEIGATGEVRSLNDLAIVDADDGINTDLDAVTQITNDGLLIGVVDLGGGDDRFSNQSDNSWNIRNFADTDGNDIRDTENVALSDFGAGDDTFSNSATGTIRLLTVEDMTSLTADTSDDTAPVTWLNSGVTEYFPEGNNPLQPSMMRSITETGIEQAHLVNLETFENAGLITLADADTGGTEAVAGDVFVITGADSAGISGNGRYVSNDGQLHLDTVLNDGSTDESDLFVIDQAELGSSATQIKINSARSGSGASTDVNGNGTFDVDEGILIVQALNSGSEAGAFELSAPVIEGGWEYLLDQTDGQSWYLHSQLSGATPLYESYPQHLLGLMKLPSLRQRVGDRQWLGFDCDVSKTDDCQRNNSMWFRVDGQQNNLTPSQSTTGSEFEQTLWKVQTGLDLALFEGEAGQKLIGSVTGQFDKGDTDVESDLDNGNIQSTSAGVGTALTWYGSDGFYVDAQGQVNWYDSDLSSDRLGSLATGQDATGYGVSLEIGKALKTGRNWRLTPQAQLSYTNIDFDSFSDRYGASVALDEAEHFTLRLGLGAERESQWEDAEARAQRSSLFARLNLFYDFGNESQVDLSGLSLVNDPEDWRGGLELGFDRSFDDGAYDFFSMVNIATSIGNFGESTQYGASLGLRLNW